VKAPPELSPQNRKVLKVVVIFILVTTPVLVSVGLKAERALISSQLSDLLPFSLLGGVLAAAFGCAFLLAKLDDARGAWLWVSIVLWSVCLTLGLLFATMLCIALMRVY
jgi:hypothetical protein